MPFFKTDDLQNWTNGEWKNLDKSKKPEIRGFTIDSRNVDLIPAAMKCVELMPMETKHSTTLVT